MSLPGDLDNTTETTVDGHKVSIQRQKGSPEFAYEHEFYAFVDGDLLTDSSGNPITATELESLGYDYPWIPSFKEYIKTEYDS